MDLFLFDLQEIDENEENDQRHFMFPDTKCNIVFTHTDIEERWNDGDTRKTKQIQGKKHLFINTELKYNSKTPNVCIYPNPP